MIDPVPSQASPVIANLAVNTDAVAADPEAAPAASAESRSALISTIAWFRDLMLSVLIAVLVILFLYRPVKVEGTSMMPSLLDQERLFINQFSYKFGLGDIKRGDTVVFCYPEDTSKSYIKRVIGLPGDTVAVENGYVLVNQKKLEENYIPFDYRDDRPIRQPSCRPTNISCWATTASSRMTAVPGASCRAAISTAKQSLSSGPRTRRNRPLAPACVKLAAVNAAPQARLGAVTLPTSHE